MLLEWRSHSILAQKFFISNVPVHAYLFVCSTVASALNSLAAVTIKDFLGAGFNVKVAENKGALLSKWISVFFGALSFLLIFIVKQMDSVLKVSSAFLFFERDLRVRRIVQTTYNSAKKEICSYILDFLKMKFFVPREYAPNYVQYYKDIPSDSPLLGFNLRSTFFFFVAMSYRYNFS